LSGGGEENETDLPVCNKETVMNGIEQNINIMTNTCSADKYALYVLLDPYCKITRNYVEKQLLYVLNR
jgi:hypothetical protein